MTCRCVADHVPNTKETHDHHVWPKANGGPDTEWNMVELCPTAHSNVHKLMRAWFRLGSKPAWSFRRGFTVTERRVAEQGYRWTTDPASRPT